MNIPKTFLHNPRRRWRSAAVAACVAGAGLVGFTTNLAADQHDETAATPAQAGERAPSLERDPHGWTAVHAPFEPAVWVPNAFLLAAGHGDVSEAVTDDGTLVGYYLQHVGYVDRATFESSDFDWRDLVRASADDRTEQDREIDQIEANGGLAEATPTRGAPAQ